MANYFSETLREYTGRAKNELKNRVSSLGGDFNFSYDADLKNSLERIKREVNNITRMDSYKLFSKSPNEISPFKVMRNIVAPSTKEVSAHDLTTNTPWPSPNPLDPVNLPHSVIHVPQQEVEEFLDKVVARYIRTLQKNSVKSVLESIRNDIVQKVPDKCFTDYIFNTAFTKFLYERPSQWDQQIFFDFLDNSEDYMICNIETVGEMMPFDGVFIEKTKTLFKRVANRMKPIAIYIADYVVTPYDRDKWELAKIFVLQGGGVALLSAVHPRIHFPVDAINGITKSLIPVDHVLYQLLEPHMYIQLPLNFAVQYISKSIAHGDQNEIYTALPCDKHEFFKQMIMGYKGFEESTHFKEYKFKMGPETYKSEYNDFLNDYWHVVYRFVEEVCQKIDLNDPLLKVWANSIANVVSGFPNYEMIIKEDNFIKAVTEYIHNCSVSHAVDHYTYARIPLKHAPMRMRIPFPLQHEDYVFDPKVLISKEDYIRHKFANVMFYKESNLTLLQDSQYKFADDNLQSAAATFRSNLRALDHRLGDDAFIPLNEISASIQY